MENAPVSDADQFDDGQLPTASQVDEFSDHGRFSPDPVEDGFEISTAPCGPSQLRGGAPSSSEQPVKMSSTFSRRRVSRAMGNTGAFVPLGSFTTQRRKSRSRFEDSIGLGSDSPRSSDNDSYEGSFVEED